MEYIAVLNNYLEYTLDYNHTVNLSFQSTSVSCSYATWSIKYSQCYIFDSLNLTD